MKKITKAAILAAGVALACQGVYASESAGDLIIGFNGFTSGSPAAASDYIANLGLISSFTVNEDLSSALSTSGLTAASGLNVGAIAETQTGSGLTLASTLFATTIRTGAGSYTSAGTETVPDPLVINRTQGNSAAGVVTSLSSGLQLSSGGSSWSSSISSAPSTTGANNVNYTAYLHGGAGNTSVNPQDSPLVNFGASSTVVEDLWKETDSSGQTAWTYVGDLTVNLGGSEPVVTWDAVSAVPEPASYGVIAGAGLLLLALRRRFVRNAA